MLQKLLECTGPGDTSGLWNTGRLSWIVCFLPNTAAINEAGAKDKHHFSPCKEHLHVCTISPTLRAKCLLEARANYC